MTITYNNAEITTTYRNETFDFGSLPQSSVVRIWQGGISHILGNRVASKLAAFIAKNKLRRDDEDDAATIEAEESRLFAEAVKALRDGTIATHRGGSGPRKTSIEVQITRIAKEEIRARAAKAGKTAALPKTEADWGALIGKFMASPAGVAVRAEAQRVIDRLNAVDTTDLDDLFDDLTPETHGPELPENPGDEF